MARAGSAHLTGLYWSPTLWLSWKLSKRQVGFSPCWAKAPAPCSSSPQGLGLGLLPGSGGGGLRLPAGPQLMMRSQLVPENTQQEDSPSHSLTGHSRLGWHHVLWLRPKQEHNAPNCAPFAGTWGRTIYQVQSYLSPMGSEWRRAWVQVPTSQLIQWFSHCSHVSVLYFFSTQCEPDIRGETV